MDTENIQNKEAKKKNMLFQSKFVIVFLLFAIVAGGLVGYKIYNQHTTQKQATTKTVIKQVLIRRSKILNVIIKATTAKAIDVKTGKVITAARVFSLVDKTIYLALDLNSPKSGTHIDYIRYLNGRYVDHGNVKIQNDQTNTISFSWTNVRTLGSVADGKWKIATYTNGILEKRVSYVVQKDQVSDVYPQESINPLASDYQLDNTIALLSLRR